jgi:MYXO-CTERM domain-containing protein
MRHARAARLALVLTCVVAACTDPRGATQEREAAGSWRGELVVTIVDSPIGRRALYSLRTPSGQRRLQLAAEPEVEAGTTIRVWGLEAGGAISVSRLEVEQPAAEANRRALIGATAKPKRQWAFVLIDTGAGVNLTADQARQKAFSDAPSSLKSYFREVSYGVQEIDGQVFGPIKHPLSDCSFDSMSELADSVRSQISGTFNQYLWYLGKDSLGCDWGGLGDLGTAARPARDSWYNAWSACGVLIQEPGHNFGMDHSSSVRCTKNGQAVPMALPGDGTCRHSEYGNIFDPMGDGECVHMDGVQKAYQEWLKDCNVVKVTASGTFTIYPLEKACTGVQLLQIPLPAARTLRMSDGSGTTNATLTSYYLELRAPIGLDAQLSPRVFVTTAGDIRSADRSGRHNWLLDMTPETSSMKDAALPVGRMFSDPDPSGPKFTVMSADAEKAVIKVELAGAAADGPGAGTCDDGSAFTAPGPETCVAPQTVVPDGGLPPPADAGASMPPLRDAAPPRDAGREAASVPIDSEPAPPPDTAAPPVAHDGGSGAEGRADAGESAEPGVPPAGNALHGGIGCSCRVGDREGPALGPAVFVAVLGALRRRRRP